MILTRCEICGRQLVESDKNRGGVHRFCSNAADENQEALEQFIADGKSMAVEMCSDWLVKEIKAGNDRAIRALQRYIRSDGRSIIPAMMAEALQSLEEIKGYSAWAALQRSESVSMAEQSREWKTQEIKSMPDHLRRGK